MNNAASLISRNFVPVYISIKRVCEYLENFNSSEFYKFFLYPNFIILNIISVSNGAYFITSGSCTFFFKPLSIICELSICVFCLCFSRSVSLSLDRSLNLQWSFGASCKPVFGKERLVGGSVGSYLDMQCLDQRTDFQPRLDCVLAVQSWPEGQSSVPPGRWV